MKIEIFIKIVGGMPFLIDWALLVPYIPIAQRLATWSGNHLPRMIPSVLLTSAAMLQ